MTVVSVLAMIGLLLVVLGVLWAQSEYDCVKAKSDEKWPDNWHELLK